MLAHSAPFDRLACAVVLVLGVALFPPSANSAGSGRIGVLSVKPGSVLECKGSGPCRVEVPVVRTPSNADPCAIDGMVETVKVFAPMLVVWSIKPATGDTNNYRFSAGRGIRFVKPASTDPLPTDVDFDDPDYEDSSTGEFINKRGYRWTSKHGSLGTEFHYEINLLVRKNLKWVKCSAADPKIVNTN